MTLKLTFALAAVGGAALITSGCGNDVPSGAVAKVGDSTIEKSEFDKWFATATKSATQGGAAAAPDPDDDFEKCAQAIVSQPVPQGSQKPSEEDARKQCKDQYEQLKDEVMQFLIQAEWVEQEAENQDVKVSDAEVERSLEDQKKQAFPKEKDYQEFLEDLGHDRGGHPLPRQDRHAADQAHPEDHRGRGQGLRRGRRGVLRREQGDVRPARAP